MRKIPAAAVEREEGKELRPLRLRLRRQRQRRQKLPAWCAESGRGGLEPRARRRVRCVPGVLGAGWGSSAQSALCAAIGAGHVLFGERGTRTVGRVGAANAGDTAGRPAPEQPPALSAPATRPGSHPVKGTAAASSPLAFFLARGHSIPSVLQAPPLLRNLSSAVPHSAADFLPLTWHSFPPVPSHSTLFPSVPCRVRASDIGERPSGSCGGRQVSCFFEPLQGDWSALCSEWGPCRSPELLGTALFLVTFYQGEVSDGEQPQRCQ